MLPWDTKNAVVSRIQPAGL